MQEQTNIETPPEVRIESILTPEDTLMKLSSAPITYTEEEKAEFLRQLKDWQRKHPYLRPGQKKIRNKMTHLIPKKKKRK